MGWCPQYNVCQETTGVKSKPQLCCYFWQAPVDHECKKQQHTAENLSLKQTRAKMGILALRNHTMPACLVAQCLNYTFQHRVPNVLVYRHAWEAHSIVNNFLLKAFNKNKQHHTKATLTISPVSSPSPPPAQIFRGISQHQTPRGCFANPFPFY